MLRSGRNSHMGGNGDTDLSFGHFSKDQTKNLKKTQSSLFQIHHCKGCLYFLAIRVVLTVKTIKRQALNQCNFSSFTDPAHATVSVLTCLLPFSAFAVQLLLQFSNVVLEYRSCKNDEGRRLAVTLVLHAAVTQELLSIDHKGKATGNSCT